jgi:Holliday junction DNA helicase RuvB
MEDFSLDIVIGKGPSARSIRLKLPRFTVVGATTRLALVTAPLRARFGAVYRLDYYEQHVLEQIIARLAAARRTDRSERARRNWATWTRHTARGAAFAAARA